MVSEAYRAALEAAKKELAEMVSEGTKVRKRTEEIDNRIAELRQSVAALSKLAGEKFDEEQALGLTDAIRHVMRESANRPMTAQDVRRRLESQGFTTRRYGNLLASVITVLKRLHAKAEIEKCDDVDGKAAYKMVVRVPMPVSSAPTPSATKLR